MNKIIINVIAHDGITSIYTGLGTIVYDTLNIFCQKSVPLKDCTINAITGKYNSKCLGFDKHIRNITKQKLKNTGGRLYECYNGSGGDVSYGDIKNWKIASLSAAKLIKQISKNHSESLCINLCFDTPFANVADYYCSQNKIIANNVFIWIPHSSSLIHKINPVLTVYPDYFKKRLAWEKRSINLINTRDHIYLGYIGQFMKQHLLETFQVDSKKCINFTDGLDVSSIKHTIYKNQNSIKSQLQKFSIPIDKKILFSFGRLEPYKGFNYTIKIGGLLAKKGYQTVLMAQPYTKEDPLIDKYKKIFQKLNPTGIFLYDYPFDLPHAVLQWHNTKILLIPSLAEPFGLIPEEARLYQNQNMAIVAANVDGLVEQINNGVDGFLINTNNFKKSYVELEKIISISDKQLKKISVAGYKTTKTKYNLKRNLTNSIKEILQHEETNRYNH